MNFLERYSRQRSILGDEGQTKLANAKILIVGIGGLGSPIALYLAAAGIGTLGLIDNDTVSISNLQRQVLYSEEELNLPKVDCAEKKLKALNSNIKVNKYNIKLELNNAKDIISNYDIVIDGCDNIATRHLINNTSKELNIPYIYGAINACDGQVAVFNYKSKISYSDLFPEKVKSATSEKKDSNNASLKTKVLNPVIGLTPAIIGSTQAMEAIKIITGIGEVLDGKLWTYNLLNNESSRYNLASVF